MTDNTYVIHDAEKEKPEKSFLGSSVSKRVLGWTGEEYEKVYYGFLTNEWFLERGGKLTVTHWTSLPPDPPKPKRWVKKEADFLVSYLTPDPKWMETTYKIPVGCRNRVCTYEIEEDV